jgi:hypothetical protein
MVPSVLGAKKGSATVSAFENDVLATGRHPEFSSDGLSEPRGFKTNFEEGVKPTISGRWNHQKKRLFEPVPNSRAGFCFQKLNGP